MTNRPSLPNCMIYARFYNAVNFIFMLKFKLYRLSVPLQHFAVALILVGLQIGTYLGNSVQISLNVGLPTHFINKFNGHLYLILS